MQCIGITKQEARCKNKARVGFCKSHRNQAWRISFVFISLLAAIITIWHSFIVPVFGLDSETRQQFPVFPTETISASSFEKLNGEINQGELWETIESLSNEGYKIIWIGWQSDGVASNKIWALFHLNPNSRNTNGRAIAFGKPYGKLQVEYSTGKGKSNLSLVEEKRSSGYIGLDLNQLSR